VIAPATTAAPRSQTPLVGYLVADAISLVGTRLSMIAIPWLVLVTTGSPAKTGLVAFAELAPLVLVKAGAGPLIDRVGARRIAVGCDLLSAVVVGLIPLLHTTSSLTFGALFVLVALGGALRGPSDGAKSAFVPAVAKHARVPLERVTGLSSAIERSATFVGAAAAAALVAIVGPANALAIDAVSFAVCAAVFGLSTRGMPSEQAQERSPGTSYLQELRGGWDYLRTDAVLVGLCIMVATTNLLDIAFTAVLVPVWAHDNGLGAAAVGTFFAVFAAFSAVGALLAAWLGARLKRFPTYLVAFLITGLPRFLVLALGLPMSVVLVTAAVGGLASGFLNPILGAVIYERIPAPLMGRVTSLNSALCWSLMPFGGILGGVLVEAIGLEATLIWLGLAYFAATMMPLVWRSFREFDRRPVAAEDRTDVDAEESTRVVVAAQ
jgi:MFS family permease